MDVFGLANKYKLSPLDDGMTWNSMVNGFMGFMSHTILFHSIISPFHWLALANCFTCDSFITLFFSIVINKL